MRSRRGRQSLAAITFISGWAAAAAMPASGAIVYETTPRAMAAGVQVVPVPPATRATPVDPGLPTGALELPAAAPRTTHAAKLTPPAAAALQAANRSVPSSPVDDAAAANQARTEPQVGPTPQVIEMAPPVPEPSTGLLLLAGGLVAMVRRNRRRHHRPGTSL